ncbi:armadillo-type protein [Tuber indicum]|nr:armadillo-type protein [Tuber indicum]
MARTSMKPPAAAKKGGTKSTKNHTFQSFTQKLQNIKIDPVRKVRRRVLDEGSERSFFHSALEKWVDLNLSTTFVELFVRPVRPLSESLPHILHHKETIFGLLVEGIKTRDVNALEPLLDLLTQFAHDLGVEFQGFFEESVGLLAALVAEGFVEAQVVEWVFGALAYLLKYLSRLLAGDLRPLFGVVRGMLGWGGGRGFVRRCAGEAVGFLVRRVKAEVVRDLARAVFEDLRECEGAWVPGYMEGLMGLFKEGCVGVDRGLHSKAPIVLESLVQVAKELGEDIGGRCFQIIEGVLISLIHHTNDETFHPALRVVYAINNPNDELSTRMSARLLYTCLTVRKGNRISDWGTAAEVAVANTQIIMGLPDDSSSRERAKETMWESLKAVAMVMQTADMEAVIARLGRIMDSVREFQDGRLFLPFCELLADTGVGRFRVFMLPYFQRFITAKWAIAEDNLLYLIPKLGANGSLVPSEDTDRTTMAAVLGDKSPVTAGAVNNIQEFLENIGGGGDQDTLRAQAVKIWEYLNAILSLSDSLQGDQLPGGLADALEQLLNGLFSLPENTKFASLTGKVLTMSSKYPSMRSRNLEEPLAVAFPKLADNAVFLQGVVGFFSLSTPKKLTDKALIPMADKLITNLSSSSHDIRSHSLRCLELLHVAKAPRKQVSSVISTAQIIENSPLEVSNARNISLYVRRLASEYSSVAKGSWESRVVPYFCFGLLTVHFSPVWDDASATLSKVAERDEEMVAMLAFEWLERQYGTPEASDSGTSDGGKAPLNGFECSNLNMIEEVAKKCVMGGFEAVADLERKFAEDLKTPTLSTSIARMQALKVLTEVPRIAEKRSRKLVPMFLEWSTFEDTEDGEDEEETKTPSKWLRKEQSAMLTLFSKFTNPRSLYKSDAVYSALLSLLASGDPKVQALVLECIFTWRIPAIRTYEDNLKNLLDDTRFRDEITHFVQIGEDESMIQDDHRQKLMPVLLRLLYGRILSRKNATSGKKGMECRRTVVLASLANFQQWERELFIEIALGNLAEVSGRFVEKRPERYILHMEALGTAHVSNRKQMGFVRMAGDMIRQLGSSLLPFMEKIVDAFLYCLVMATKTIDSREDIMDGLDDAVAVKAARAIRQGGVKCLGALFSSCPTFPWAHYMPAIFDELVNPRLDALPIETSQSPSGLLQLFSTWANSKDTVMFLEDYNLTVLSRIAACLANKSVKDEVVLFIIKMVKQIVSLADSEGGVGPRLLEPNVDVLLVNLGGILHKSPGKEVLEQAVEAISKIAPFVSGDTETTHLVELSVFLLRQPSRRVSPKAKSDILKILLHFLPLCVMEKESKLYEDTFRCVSSLFGFFKDRENRETLAGVFNVFAERDEELVQVAELSRQLNSFSDRRLDEPDFEQRLRAYGKINEDLYLQFSPKQWIPLIFNMLFLIRDNEELAIRTNASYALKRFAESCGQKSGTEEKEAYLNILSETLMPALKNGAREQSEFVRMEYVAIVAHVVKECSFWEEVSDMKALLVGDDEEANFFNNILHIQQHRRLRALRRLATTSRGENTQSSNITHFFLPLVEHFVFDQAEDAHNLASETVVTIGALAEQLTWTQYRALFRRYTGYLKSKPELEKIVVRLIGTTVNSLARATAAKGNAAAVVKDGGGDVPMGNAMNRLAESLPEQRTLAEDISGGFLSPLSEYLHQKEESTVSLRVPIAISIAKLLKFMPDDMLRLRLPPVLTDVCHILRSRSQESRDMTRKTLTEITTLLGPQYFEFVLKELRGALLRGYQLHVLSFTMHSILVSVTPTYSPGALDYCVGQMVSVVMDDIFGVTGMEKDAEGYVSKMREVKSSKSYDSMDLIASVTTLPYLGGLIRPIGALLKENMNLRMSQKIDELLRRITVGLLRNKEVGSEKTLIFCYEVIHEGYRQDTAEAREEEVDPKTQRYLVNLKVPSKAASGVATSSHMYKLTRFALDILRTTLQKHDGLMTSRNLANFIPVIGDALLSKYEEVQTSALRVLTTIIRTPLPAIDEGAEVFMGQALSFIKSCPSMNAELAQASLKLMSSVLRERRSVKIKERTIGYLLTRVKPDLEEPDRQGATFNFLKAVLARKVVIPEVYDVLDSVAAIMVTNQTRSVRDLARGVYFQFLMEYPQGRDRLNKQLAFLVKNLDYVHQSGRQSVLEVVNLLYTKVGDSLIQQVLGTFFVPLVMRLINDDSSECREMAGALLRKALERADADNLSTFTMLMKNWLGQDQKPLLVRSALQIYGLYLDAFPTSAKRDLPFVMGELQSIIRASSTDQDAHWENLYFSLQTWARIVLHFPATTFSADQAPAWTSIHDCLSFPHAWVRLSAARLTGLLFAEYAAKATLSTTPLDNGAGLTLSAEAMVHIARRTSSHLNSPELSEELGLQVVKNLLFLARCFHAAGVGAISSVPMNDPELDDVEEEQHQQEEGRIRRSALEWLVQRISAILRSERNIKKGLLGKRFAMQWIAALIQLLPKGDLEPLAKTLVRPLYNVLEVDGMHLMKDLKPTAQELQSSIAEKLGTTLFAIIYSQVKSEALERRRVRKGKRAILAVTDPEKAAAKKIKKHERKREVRKEKGRAEREGRWGRGG